MNTVLRKLCALLCVFVLLGGTAVVAETAQTAEETQYRELQKGDSGPDVLALKQRMYYLGYFNSLKNLTNKYNDVMAKRVAQLQKNNGLDATGIATPELQELIFSDECVWVAPTPKPTLVPTPAPTPVRPQADPGLPELDAEGFLPEGETEPFVYENAEDGHWIYLSDDISVDIQRMTDETVPLIWFESRIRTRNEARLGRLLAQKKGKDPGHTFLKPQDILDCYDNVIFACSDDFFGYRWNFKQTQGIILNNGEVLSEKTFKKLNNKAWPQLDILAVFRDGTAKAYPSNAYTAQEYVDMGVMETYAFGPILAEEGKVSDDVYAYAYADSRLAPRTAIGSIGANDFMVLTVTGRRKDSKGATILWLAQKMTELGVQEAINLDGGNTCSLFFMGQLLNRPEIVQDKDIRSVSGLIGVAEGE